MPWGYICESVAELFATRVGIVLHHHHSEYCTKSLRLSSKLRGWFSFTVFVRCLSSVCVAVYPLCVSPSVLCVCSLSILCVCPSSVFCVCPPSVFCVCVRPLSSVYVRPLSSVYVHPLSSVFVRSLLNPWSLCFLSVRCLLNPCSVCSVSVRYLLNPWSLCSVANSLCIKKCHAKRLGVHKSQGQPTFWFIQATLTVL